MVAPSPRRTSLVTPLRLSRISTANGSPVKQTSPKNAVTCSPFERSMVNEPPKPGPWS